MALNNAENIQHRPSGVEPFFLTNRVNQHISQQTSLSLAQKKLALDNIHLNFAEPDYLGLSSHPSIIEAGIRTLMDTDSNNNSRSIHQTRAETRMAEFLQAGGVAFFQSVWNTNLPLLQAVSEKTIPIYYDTMANFSIREAIQQTESPAFIYSRESPEELEKLLQENGAGIIIVDALSSIDGSTAKLTEIAQLSHQYRCLFIVDESHSLGIVGAGRGLVFQLQLQQSVHFITARLTKTLCCQTPLIAGSQRNVEYVRHYAKKSHLRSALVSEESEKILATLQIIQKDDWRRVKLCTNANYLRTRLHRCGFNVNMNSSHIVNIFFDDTCKAEALYRHLFLKGVAVDYQTSPLALTGTDLIRLIVNTKHNKQQIDELISLMDFSL